MYVYEPVPSRRLGRSLGVSPIPPKTYNPLRSEQAASIERAYSVLGIVEKMLRIGELIQIEYNGKSCVLPGHFRMGYSGNSYCRSTNIMIA